MKIEVTRSGGVAGMSRRGAVEFSLRGAQDESDAEWAALYRQARSERGQLAASGEPADDGAHSPSHVRDAFQWTLLLGRERIEVPDSYLSGALRELAERVLAEGR